MGDQGLEEKHFADVLWSFFALHANQRIQLLDFYIVLESLVVTGLMTLFSMENDVCLLKIVLSVAVVFFSFVFYRLDVRTRTMVKYAENGLKHIEQGYSGRYDNELMIFTIEAAMTDMKRQGSMCPLTYSQLFGLVYLFFTTAGITGLILTFMGY